MSHVLYPDKADIERACQEHDGADNTGKLIEMWGRVKGANANGFTYVILGIAAVGLIAGVIVGNLRKKKPHGKRRK